LPDGTNLSRELVRAGLAWWYCKYSTDPILAALELEAYGARRGLWSDPNPIPPWELRCLSKKRPTLTSALPAQRHLAAVQEIDTAVVDHRESKTEAIGRDR
jgi:hypothetical protein